MNTDTSDHILSRIDAHRMAQGFLSIALLFERYANNIILDPFSTLISEDVEIGEGNLIYPNVVLDARQGGLITLGNRNILWPGTLFLAHQGTIRIGDDNEFGDGGLRLKAIVPDTSIIIGNDGRYTNNAAILSPCVLDSGSQVLGPITVQNSTLEAGESYKHDDPDRRAGVLKGVGQARNLKVKQGEVINGQGVFDQAKIERQLSYHPRQK